MSDEELDLLEEDEIQEEDHDDDQNDHDDAEDENLSDGGEVDHEGNAEAHDQAQQKRDNARKNRERRERRAAAKKRFEQERLETKRRLEEMTEVVQRLAAENAEIKNRTYQNDVRVIDSQLQNAYSELATAEHLIAQAAAINNGEDLVSSFRYRDQAQAKLAELERYKQQLAQPMYDQKSSVPQGTDYALERHRQEFLRKHDWYDARARDEDSAIVKAIDASLSNAGFDPRTKEYWAELENRMRKRLPERFPERVRKGGPSVSGNRNYAPEAQRPNNWRTPARLETLKALGVKEGEPEYNEYVKAYIEHDKRNPR